MLYIQLIGVLAFSILVLSFYRKTPKEILIFQMTANFAYATHYLLLGALTGAYTNVVSIIRNLLFLKVKKNKKIVGLIIIFLYLVITILFYEGLYSILPFIANSIYVLHMIKGDKKSLLIGSTLSSLLWFLYGVFILSYSEMITETILCISSLIQLRKHKNIN